MFNFSHGVCVKCQSHVFLCFHVSLALRFQLTWLGNKHHGTIMNHEDLYISIYFLLNLAGFSSHLANLWGSDSLPPGHPQERLDLRSCERIDDGFRVARIPKTGEKSMVEILEKSGQHDLILGFFVVVALLSWLRIVKIPSWSQARLPVVITVRPPVGSGHPTLDVTTDVTVAMGGVVCCYHWIGS